MHILYNENEPYTGPHIRIDSMDPHKPWRTHCENWYHLKFIAERGTFLEKRRAMVELSIAERKMKFWERHHAFRLEEQIRITDEIRRKWNA
jgi:hypothetical protein